MKNILPPQMRNYFNFINNSELLKDIFPAYLRFLRVVLKGFHVAHNSSPQN
jgi:hypothetical protein